MGAIEEGGKLAQATVAGLSGNPMVLALVMINLVFLVGGGWIIHDVADRTAKGNERRDKMLTDLMLACRSFEAKENGK